jgi:hypothetical protein
MISSFLAMDSQVRHGGGSHFAERLFGGVQLADAPVDQHHIRPQLLPRQRPSCTGG